MKIFVRLALVCVALLALTGFWVLGRAQPVDAQSPAGLADVEIALWPEYDQPEVLVIYRAQVAQDAPLPATVSFGLPAAVQAMNAVAYLDETKGTLINIPDYRLSPTATGAVLSLSTPARQFQAEYYANTLLTRQNATRTLAFSFTATSAVANLGFEVQQPTGTTGFDSTPAPTSTETRRDGLTYALYQLGSLAAGESRTLRVTYSRSSDVLSAVALGAVPAAARTAPAPEQPARVVPGDSTVLVWLVVPSALIVGGAVGFYVSQRRTRRQSAGRRILGSTRRTTGADESPAAYCHQCGARMRNDGLFCHVCGAPRRGS